MTDLAAALPTRKMDFEFSDAMELIFFRDDPVLSYSSHAYWMTMPYLEPYLMRSVRAALPAVKDPVLREAMKRFCAQEGQHFQQHAIVNEILKRSLPDSRALTQIEAELEADYRRFSAGKDLAFNLAYAEAFESMTMAMSRTQMEMNIHNDMAPPIRDLFLWHITEEMEHRTVAFDAYHKLGNGYWYRVRIGRWAQRHYLSYVARFHECFLAADAERIAGLETEALRRARKSFQRSFSRRFLPRLVGTFMPWYNPARIRMPAAFEPTRARYSGLAVSIS